MIKAILILGLLGLVLFVGLDAKRKFYDPKLRIVSAKTELKQLLDNYEIKNGDLIFHTSKSRLS